MTSRIVVTGSSGFIGTNLVEHLLIRGHEVLCLDIAKPVNVRHARFWRRVDILEPNCLREHIERFRPTELVHLAARTDLRGSSLNDYLANTVGVENVISAIRENETLERALFASSRMVMAIGQIPEGPRDYDPPNAYGRSKAVGEQLVREASLNASWLILRPTSIWGPWFGVPYRDFFDTVRRGQYFHPKGRRILKSFGYVGNTVHQVEALLLGAGRVAHGETLYLADYEPLDLQVWAEQIAAAFGKRRPISVPVAALELLAGVGTLLERHGMPDPKITRFRLSNLLTPMVFNMDRLETLVGPCPFGPEEGVRATVAFMQGHEPPSSYT